MEWLLALAALTIAGTFGLTAGAYARSDARLRREARQRAAAACGLEAMETGASGVISGRRGALRVRVESAGTAGARFLRVATDGIEATVQAVSAHRQWPADAIPRGGDVEVGDPFFDLEIVVLGPPATVRGLFTADARALARAVFALEARVRMGGGSLVAEFPETEGSYGPPDHRVRSLVDLALLLRPGAADEQRLAAIVSSDPLSTVRATALETLVGDAPESALTRAALRQAARDVAPAVRLKAAQALGEEGLPILHELAGGSGVDDAHAAAAVTALGPHLTSARAQQLLASAETDLRVPRVKALLHLLAGRGPAELDVVTSLLVRRSDAPASVLLSSSAEIAVAAAEALAESGSPSAEAHLVAVLASSARGVALAAVRVLAQVGTARAVPPLREAERQRGDLRSAARQAIAAIQSRLTDATPGQVSLSGDAGRLSVASSTEGHLSLETKE